MSDPIDTIKVLVGYRGDKADIEAEVGDAAIEPQRFAYASDTSELGIWTDGAWVWTGGGTSNLRWEAVTDGEDVFVWEDDDLVHEFKAY